MASEDRPVKRPRKGTRSCAECRRKKVRCEWPSSSAETCRYCSAKGVSCEQQVTQTSASDVVQVTTRARLADLERNISGLWGAVRKLETAAGAARTESLLDHVTAKSDANIQEEAEEDDDDDDEDSGSSDDFSPPNAPGHLIHLFDNGLLGSSGHEATPSLRYSSSRKSSVGRGIAALLSLLPSRDDMIQIANQASSWLSLYTAIFPMVTLNKTAAELVQTYDRIQEFIADPVPVASLLLSIAITIQQNLDASTGSTSKCVKDPESFVKDVSDAVERIVIQDDSRVGSLEGVQAAILFLRLQLGQARVTKMWLLQRRIIALAELLGLPGAAITFNALDMSSNGAIDGIGDRDRLRQKAEVWESICAIDRITSMMWQLPPGTMNSPLPQRNVVDPDGRVLPQGFIYTLAEIARKIFGLDNFRTKDNLEEQLFIAVMRIDHDLRSLASLAPRDWWNLTTSELNVDALLQYWHKYLTVRAHIRLALTYEESKQQFALNFITCMNSCQDLGTRYLSLRPSLPIGFFANWLIDMQAFTSVVFLLLARYRVTSGDGNYPEAFDVGFVGPLVEQVAEVMAATTGRSADDFAHQAAKSILSLDSLLQQPQGSETRGGNISLSLPLLGTVHVSRKVHSTTSKAHSTVSSCSTCTETATTVSSDTDLLDSLQYSMEISESYLFSHDEANAFGSEQWSDWSMWQ